MGPAVLGKRGKEDIKLFLGKTDDVGSCFFSELFKIELGGSAKCFEGGCRSERGWGADDVWVGINGGGFKRVGVDESNAGAGGGVRILWGLGDIDVIWARARGGEEGEAGDDELELEFGTGGNGGRPGDDTQGTGEYWRRGLPGLGLFQVLWGLLRTLLTTSRAAAEFS